jgi:glycine hydroxymethyltransferase
LCHVIAAKAVAFAEALRPEFKVYAQQIVDNCQSLAEGLLSKGFRLCTGGTDNHLVLVDLRNYNEKLTGAVAETALHSAGIVVNKNLIPYDPRKPMEASGIRIGTAALTTRGLKTGHMSQIAMWIDKVLANPDDERTIAAVRKETAQLCKSFPIP